MSYTVPKAPKFIPCPRCGYEEVVADEGPISRLTHRRRCWRCGNLYHGRTGRRAEIEHCIDLGLMFVLSFFQGIP